MLLSSLHGPLINTSGGHLEMFIVVSNLNICSLLQGRTVPLEAPCRRCKRYDSTPIFVSQSPNLKVTFEPPRGKTNKCDLHCHVYLFSL